MLLDLCLQSFDVEWNIKNSLIFVNYIIKGKEE